MATILVVEDDPVLRSLISRTLERAGHDTFALESVQAATDALAALTPDLVVVDVNLPDGSGLDLARSIRDRFGPRVPVLLSSGLHVTPEEAGTSGADGFLQKPFMLADLLKRCDDLLGSGFLGSGCLIEPFRGR